jgi:hypothetical protein
VALAAAILLSLRLPDAIRASRAREQIALLERALHARHDLTGSYPRRLTDLGWRLYALLDDGETVDPWGRRYVYRTPGTEGRPFDLGSLGPDGLPSGDDVGRPPPAEER